VLVDELGACCSPYIYAARALSAANIDSPQTALPFSCFDSSALVLLCQLAERAAFEAILGIYTE
jgi:hypothetical protein